MKDTAVRFATAPTFIRYEGIMPVEAHLLWCSEVSERKTYEGKYVYTVDLALIYSGEETGGMDNVWAWTPFELVKLDFNELKLQVRDYNGTQTQPDPRILEVVSKAVAPTYRGCSYLVIERFPLMRNQIPNFAVQFKGLTKRSWSDRMRSLWSSILHQLAS